MKPRRRREVGHAKIFTSDLQDVQLFDNTLGIKLPIAVFLSGEDRVYGINHAIISRDRTRNADVSCLRHKRFILFFHPLLPSR